MMRKLITLPCALALLSVVACTGDLTQGDEVDDKQFGLCDCLERGQLCADDGGNWNNNGGGNYVCWGFESGQYGQCSYTALDCCEEQHDCWTFPLI